MKVTIKPGDQVHPLNIEGRHYRTGKPVSVRVIGGKIIEVNEIASLKRGSENVFVSPGLIDNQINGYANVDFTGDNLTVEGVLSATREILGTGVTSFMPTLITSSHESLKRNFSVLAKACEDSLVNSCVPGFHLEGPYISRADGFRGTHAAEHVRKPSWKEFIEYNKASENRIIQVTVAPEVEGALDFIKKCVSEGIIVAIGHSNANSRQIDLAVENGAVLSTHLGNGCANMIHRHNNPLWPQLANDKLIPSIIADGNHLLPEEVKVFIKAKGTDNIILTSDVVYLAGMKPGRYTFSGMDVELKEDGTLLNIAQHCLAGASFPLKKGVGNVMKFAGLTLGEAVKMASENVARIYNLKGKGEIKPGYAADLILFEIENYSINIRQVFKEGKLL
jgi:N-acetylglucosamine-6-phosphate deacetylase